MMNHQTLTTPHRIAFLDHLRGFAFALMAIDHSLHGYALHWGRFWFFQDSDRSLFFDVLYMHNNSIIIPLLFFVMGTFVIPGLKNYGVKAYLKNRFIRYGIPFCIGVPFIVPLLTYPKYVTNSAPGIGFFDYWSQTFFVEKLQAGPFWVVYALLLYTLISVGSYTFFPRVFKAFSSWVQWMIRSPFKGFAFFGGVCALILGISDLLWGAPWWIGFGKLFYMQGSRFLQQGLFFFCGTAIGCLPSVKQEALWNSLSRYWVHLVILTGVLGGAYIGYSLTYFHEGAYDMTLLLHFHRGGQWHNIWPIVMEVAPGRLIRTTLHAFFCLSQVMMFMALFHTFFKRPTPLWTSLAANGFGIFLIHETLVVFCQYWLNGVSIPMVFKFLSVAMVGLGGGWFLSNFLRKRPGFKTVIGTYPK